MRKVSKKARQLTAAISLISIIVAIFLLLILQADVLATYTNEVFFAAILVAIVPSAILDYENQRWVSAIEDQMPLLVRGVSESQETGLTLVKALEKIVENKMIGHPLSDEVRKLTIQMAWGTSFENALINFKERIGSPIVSRFCALVLEASHSGGTIKKVFTATSGFMEEMKEMDKEASSQMKPYMVVIYAAFGVFLDHGRPSRSILLRSDGGLPANNEPSNRHRHSRIQRLLLQKHARLGSNRRPDGRKTRRAPRSRRAKTRDSADRCRVCNIPARNSTKLDVKK